LSGEYDASWNFSATLYVTTVAKLSAGDHGAGSNISGTGYEWGIIWSEPDQTLWVMAGSGLQARSKTGALIESFTPSQLGDSIYSISPLDDGGLVYSVVDYPSYTACSIGRIIKTGSAYKVEKNLITGLGGDAEVFGFKNHNGKTCVLLREYNFGSDDNIYIYDASSNFSFPIVNASDWKISNTHAIATLDKYLYLVSYENYTPGSGQLSGLIRPVDMTTWPVAKHDDGSGGGCDSGFGAAFLLLLVPAAFIRYRKK
ncbi:MAG: SYNERG-CTERM sorting domain-containing protein, partial [Synergistaceae bacterium]|nr:SYNERG-CTERM sorting domain-containing protein [Synergistaceae bacterium]